MQSSGHRVAQSVPQITGAQTGREQMSPDPGVAPAWPSWMIEPDDRELARWIELWRHPRAAVWLQRELQPAVVALVRLEKRCEQSRPSAQARRALTDLKQELGLADDDQGR